MCDKVTVSPHDRQQSLPFESAKEQARLERVEWLLGDIPQVKRAARLFNEQGEREAHEAALRQ